MNMRNVLVRCFDTIVRSMLMKKRTANNNVVSMSLLKAPYIFMADGRIPHGGMFDRLKGAITIYAIAKSWGKDFRIDWTYPFDLRKYLEPNTYDWRIDEDNMRWGWFNHNVVIAYGETDNPSRLWVKRRKETHFYYGYNSLDKVNSHFGTHYDWGVLYRELFRPTPYLQKYLDYYQQEIGSEYIAVHARFLNLLGDKTETDINPELPKANRLTLMEKATAEVKAIMASHPDERVMIASDSMTFISYIKKEIQSVYIVPGMVKHIDTAGETDDAENIKMFTDYYLMAGARHVYSLWHDGMWKSAFSEYASKIGGIEFSRIEF